MSPRMGKHLKRVSGGMSRFLLYLFFIATEKINDRQRFYHCFEGSVHAKHMNGE